MLDVDALFAEMGQEAADTVVLDPDMAELGEALTYPLTMGAGAVSPEAAAEIQSGVGIPAVMIETLLAWGRPKAARAVKEAPDEEAWAYMARLVRSMVRVKGWSPEWVADNLYALMVAVHPNDPAPPALYGQAVAEAEQMQTEATAPDDAAEYSTGTGGIDGAGE